MLYHCQVCGNPFEAAPAAKRKFCSRACMGITKTKRISRICQTCGKEFFARHYKVEDGGGKYCSRVCADTGWDEPCMNCGKLVHRKPFHAQKFESVFCSRKCYGEWCSRKVERICAQCGQVFETKLSEFEAGEGIYCSKKCYNLARSQKMTTLVCQHCGQRFERPVASINSNMYQGKYCSAKCMGLARRLPDSIRSEYNHEFTEVLKEQIRARDNYTCQLCGAKQSDLSRKLDVHHIDYNKANCDPSNLVTLCRFCHPGTNYNRNWWLTTFKVLC